MRFKLNVMFALFLGQQYDTLTNGLTKDEVESYRSMRELYRNSGNYNFLKLIVEDIHCPVRCSEKYFTAMLKDRIQCAIITNTLQVVLA